MKIFKDYIAFRNRIKPVRDDFDLDIEPDFMSGIFLPNRLDELKQYCLDHPEFHIMSIMKESAVEVNNPIEGANFYLLAMGDRDPELFYTDPVSREQIEDSKIREFDRD